MPAREWSRHLICSSESRRGSTPIGAAVARLAAGNGYNVLINYNNNRAGADAVVADCQGLGAEAIAVGADVADDGDCRKLAAAAQEAWGRIDVLVNNAGTTKLCPHNDLEGLDAEVAAATKAAAKIRTAAAPTRLTGTRPSTTSS